MKTNEKETEKKRERKKKNSLLTLTVLSPEPEISLLPFTWIQSCQITVFQGLRKGAKIRYPATRYLRTDMQCTMVGYPKILYLANPTSTTTIFSTKKTVKSSPGLWIRIGFEGKKIGSRTHDEWILTNIYIFISPYEINVDIQNLELLFSLHLIHKMYILDQKTNILKVLSGSLSEKFPGSGP